MATCYGGPRRIGESGKVTLSDTIDSGITETVTFTTKYRNPVVFTFVTTNNDARAIQSRVTNVTSSSCDIFIHRDDNSSHSSSETVSYFVIEEGIHELDRGCIIEVGSVSTNSVYSKQGGSTFDSVSLTHSFSETPVLIHSLMTYNNQAFMASMIQSPSASSFNIQQNSLETQSPVSEERIAWAAITPGSYSLFEARRESDSFTHSSRRITFTNTFSDIPDIIVKGNDIDGGDGYFMRGSGNTSASYIDVFTEEDQVNDTETSHTTESPVFVAIKPNTVFFKHFGVTRKVNS